MKVFIQIAAKDDTRAWSILQRHSPGIALPDRTFVVSDTAVEALRRARVRYTTATPPDPLAALRRRDR